MITEIQDIVDTGEEGYAFLKINSGMNDMPRVAMYGVQEPIFVISRQLGDTSKTLQSYAVVGHCCESSDLLTCKLYEAETIETRELPEAHI